MKECPQCHRCFDNDVERCYLDGQSLYFSMVGSTNLEGRYKIEQRLGHGGMGVVYKARHTFLRTQHAVKIILPELVGNDDTLATRFRHEAILAASIHHQNVIHVTDFGIAQNNVPFLVMEFLEGESLAHIMKQEGRISPEKTMELLGPLCAGVGAAHKLGIIHRDLKPLNIMLKKDAPFSEGLKVLDFGLAKIISSDVSSSMLQLQTKGFIGSPVYMSPEQWSESSEIDSRTDIYCIGIILYQMLSGTLPYQGTSIPSVMRGHLLDRPPTFRSLGSPVSPIIEAVVLRAIEKQPEKRHQTTAELFSAFYEAVRSSKSSSYSRSANSADLTKKLPPIVDLKTTISSDRYGLPEDQSIDTRYPSEPDVPLEISEARRREEEDARQRQGKEERFRLEEMSAVRRAEDAALERLAEISARRRAEAEARKQEEEARLKREAELARQQAEEEARQQEEARLKWEAELARQRAEEEARQQEEARLEREAELARQRAEEEARQQEEARLEQEAELARQREEKARKLEEVRLKREAELARQRAEEKARQKEEARLKREAAAHQRLEEESARRRAEEEARLRAEEEAKQLRQEVEKAKKLLEEEAAKRAEHEAKKKAEEARRRTDEEALLRAEREAEQLRQEVENAKKLIELEAIRRTEEEAKKQAEEEGRRQAELEARRLALEIEQAKKIAAEEARERAEEEARLHAAEQARLFALEEAKRLELAAALKRSEEEARKRADEEVARRQKAEEEHSKATEKAQHWEREVKEAHKRAELEAKNRSQEEARLRAELESQRLAHEAEESLRLAREVERAKKLAMEEATKRAEEAQLLAMQEAERLAREVKEAKQIAEEESRRRAEEQKMFRAEEQARKRAEQEAKRLEREVKEVKKLAQEEAKKRSDRKIGETGEPILDDKGLWSNTIRILGVSVGLILVLFAVAYGVYLFVRPKPQGSTPDKGVVDNRPLPNVKNMVSITGGEFTMGTNEVDQRNPTQYPAHLRHVDSFLIDKTEVSNNEYGEFIAETNGQPPAGWNAGKPPAGLEYYPVVNVSVYDAEEFAKWRSMRTGLQCRLPTEIEWEYVARSGSKGYRYPWGNEFKDNAENIGPTKSLKPVGSYPDGTAVGGVQDMLGNAFEWTSSKGTVYPGNTEPDLFPKDYENKNVIRGGAFVSDSKYPRLLTFRQYVFPTTKNEHLGFRLACNNK